MGLTGVSGSVVVQESIIKVEIIAETVLLLASLAKCRPRAVPLHVGVIVVLPPLQAAPFARRDGCERPANVQRRGVSDVAYRVAVRRHARHQESAVAFGAHRWSGAPHFPCAPTRPVHADCFIDRRRLRSRRAG